MFRPKHESVAATKEKENAREQIRSAEEKLGIQTDADRLYEASQFIDLIFLKTAAITGREHSHLLFGEKEWLGWLKAKEVINNYHGPLTVDFMLKIAAALSGGEPSINLIRNSSIYGFANQELDSIHLSQAKLDVIAQNPYLGTQYDTDPMKRRISYPEYTPGSDKMTRILSEKGKRAFLVGERSTPQLLRVFLEDMCDWFNSSEDEVVTRSVELQRKAVSIHPFVDRNGRFSRLLETWALQENGVESPVILDPALDVTRTLDEQVALVKDGIGRSNKMLERKKGLNETHHSDPAFLLGVEHAATYFHYTKEVNSILDRNTLPHLWSPSITQKPLLVLHSLDIS